MEQLYRYILYFMFGGLTMLTTSYINESGRGGMAALVASLPVFFLTTALIAYYVSGASVAIAYSKGMVLANVPWLVAVIMFGWGLNQGYHPILTAGLAMVMYLLIMFATSGLV